MYKINDWNVTNVEFLTPKPGSTPGSDAFVPFNIPDLTSEPFSNIYSDSSVVHSSKIGNSFEAVSIFDSKDTNSYFEMVIDDGTHRAVLKVQEGTITLGTESLPVLNTDKELHRYTITLKNGLITVFFDAAKVIELETTNSSVNPEMLIGFTQAQQGSAELKIKYLKRCSGAYNYLKTKDVDFELLVDAVDTFDSPNLKTYTKASFANIKEVPDAWDPISLICGDFDGEHYLFNGLVQAATIHLPPKQDNKEIPFYYKVRFNGPEYVSDYSQTYLINRVKPTALVETSTPGIYAELTAADSGYKSYSVPVTNGRVVLPATPVSDGWNVQIYNAGIHTIKVVDTLNFAQQEISPYNIVSYTYSAENSNWTSSIVQKKQSFILPPNITNLVFDAVFNHHLPAYDEVYTKAFNSGNVADILRGQAEQIDSIYATMQTQYARLSNFTADRDTMNQRWSNIFGLDKSLFKNSADMRDTMQTLILNLKGEMISKTLEYLISTITGAKPEIIEYKDLDFNILWSEKEIKQLPPNKTYYLYDEEHPSYEVKPFILYGGSDKAFSFQINVFDPYNLQYNQELIKQIVDMFKPVYSYAIINFYSWEGMPYTKRYFYGIDSYLEAAYNK